MNNAFWVFPSCPDGGFNGRPTRWRRYIKSWRKLFEIRREKGICHFVDLLQIPAKLHREPQGGF